MTNSERRNKKFLSQKSCKKRFCPGDTIHPDTMPHVTVNVQYILNPLSYYTLYRCTIGR